MWKILNWIIYFFTRFINTEKIKCKKCKGTMTSSKSYLYLLPVYFDDLHAENAEYYLNNTIPIDNEEDIPIGRRACYFHLFQCDGCSNRSISVVDFLKVRDQKVIKGGDVYPYEKFSSMLCDR